MEFRKSFRLLSDIEYENVRVIKWKTTYQFTSEHPQPRHRPTSEEHSREAHMLRRREKAFSGSRKLEFEVSGCRLTWQGGEMLLHVSVKARYIVSAKKFGL